MSEESPGNYVQDILDKYKMLEPLAMKVEVKPMHWISTPEGDQGEEWCFECGTKKVAELISKDSDKAEDYFLDGGWAIEQDDFRHCADCGVYLKVSLLSAPVEVFEENGFSSSKEEDAYEIREMLNTVDFQWPDENKDRKLERQAVVALADKFIAHHNIKFEAIEKAGGIA